MAEVNYDPDPRAKPLMWTASRHYGGGGGVGQVYVDRYPQPPDDPQDAALTYSSTTGQMLQWSISGQQWV